MPPLCAVLAGLLCCAVASEGSEPGLPQGWDVSPQNGNAPGQAAYLIRHGATGIELAHVPAGRFLMGSGRGDFDERPVHEVELSGFWIGRTEVTVAQWRQVMGRIDFEPPNDQGDDHPIVAVAWDRCQEFCRRLGLRLPTEAEWEYAAAGPESREYPWGDEWAPSLAQWAECKGPLGTERTAPVGSYPAAASWCGALDMAGNVWEWCADWYNEDYYARSPRVNPKGPDEDRGVTVGFNDGRKRVWEGRRVIRGGCFSSDSPAHLRCAYRSNDPSLWHFALGLRVARDP